MLKLYKVSRTAIDPEAIKEGNEVVYKRPMVNVSSITDDTKGNFMLIDIGSEIPRNVGTFSSYGDGSPIISTLNNFHLSGVHKVWHNEKDDTIMLADKDDNAVTIYPEPILANTGAMRRYMLIPANINITDKAYRSFTVKSDLTYANLFLLLEDTSFAYFVGDIKGKRYLNLRDVLYTPNLSSIKTLNHFGVCVELGIGDMTITLNPPALLSVINEEE